MNAQLEHAFGSLGARVKLTPVPDWQPRLRGAAAAGALGADAARDVLDTLRVDVRRDTGGEYFDVRCDPRVTVEAADVRAKGRHLLLVARVPVERAAEAPRSTFLCGHDEKAWFVAAIPETAGASDVQAAMDALKPAAVWEEIRRRGVPLSQRDSRRTAAFVRQGEWFFLPRPHVNVSRSRALRNEPIRRGAGKPHVCQFLYRVNGERVYVCDAYPNGLDEREFQHMARRERARHRWTPMVRNAHVYVKGNIRHRDHKTVFLSFWHEVVPNTETEARAMSQVAFLD
jgi:hypothetical protein